MKNQGIELSWIVVKDIKAAIKFYTETVGFKLTQSTPENSWAELSGPSGSVLGIAQECKSFDVKAGSNAVISITVEDIDVACDFFKKKGAQLVGEIIEIPGHVKMQTFKDDDGNMMQLVQKLGDNV